MKDDDEVFKRRVEEDLIKLYQEKFSLNNVQTGIVHQRFIRTASKDSRTLKCNR